MRRPDFDFAIGQAFYTLPAGKGRDEAIRHFKRALIDYLADKFTRALIHTKDEAALMDLWHDITDKTSL